MRHSRHLKCILFSQTGSCLKFVHHRFKSSLNAERQRIVNLIKRNTEISRDHLTPEIRLHLITSNTPIWGARTDECPFSDPFWGFHWPGGQGLARYILDNKNYFTNKKIIDIGCGCGATSIACKMVGASEVIANDLDPVSVLVTEMNAKLNFVSLKYEQKNMIGTLNTHYDIVLLGDMFYDSEFADEVFQWVQKLVQQNTDIFVGDPGRLPFTSSPAKSLLKQVSEYDLLEQSKLENNGLTTASVWRSFQNRPFTIT